MREKRNQNMSPERLAELVGRARSGDQDAFTALYEATSQEVYRTVRSMIRSEDTALDVQQDAYVFAFTHLDQLEEPAKFSPWLRQIAVNRTRSVLRKQTPVLFSELETDEGAGLPEVADLSPEASPEISLERQETADCVREILDGLTVGQRLLVGMYYYEQLPVGKIAEDLGVTPGTVKTQLYRSRKKIEAAVRRLEEKGVKLFGLAPLPYLVALLKKLTPAAEKSRTVLTGALTESGVAPVAEAAAVHVGRSFFQTVVGKVVLGVIAAAAIGGGVAGYRWYQENFVYGDYQPPTETVDVVLHYETQEDLTAEPTVETEEPTVSEIPEDLTTEPVETTEPIDTTEPAETTEPTDPAGADAHIGPDTTDHTDPAPQPTDPVGAGDPTGPSSEPTESSAEPTQPTESSEILGWRWQSNQNYVYTEVGSVWEVNPETELRGRKLVVSVKGDAVPELTTDRPDVVDVSWWGWYSGETTDYKPPEGVNEHKFFVTPSGAGTARVYCKLNGATVYSTTVVVTEPASAYDSTYVAQHNRSGERIRPLEGCIVGASYYFDVEVTGTVPPEIVTDNPGVVSLPALNSGAVHWPRRNYYLTASIVGSGDANIWVKLNGETCETYRVHATEYVRDLYDSEEDLLPPDAPNQVLYWYAGNQINPKVISKGRSFELFVGMVGAELPELRTEDPTVAVVESTPSQRCSGGNNRMHNWFPVRGISAGETTLICEFHGEVIFTLPIRVTDSS